MFDSYLENSTKESTRASRPSDVEPTEYVNLLLVSSLLVELKRFWASSKNKEELQILPRKFFKQKAEETNLTLVLSGCVTDGGGILDCVMFKSGRLNTKEKLKLSMEEADSRLIQRLIKATKYERQRVVVISNNTDVVVYCLTYENRCRIYGCKEAWLRFGAREKTRNISIHVLGNRLGDHI